MVCKMMSLRLRDSIPPRSCCSCPGSPWACARTACTSLSSSSPSTSSCSASSRRSASCSAQSRLFSYSTKWVAWPYLHGTTNDCRVTYLLAGLGWVGLDLGTYGWWAAIVAFISQSRMVEHFRSSMSTRPRSASRGSRNV